jgi:hypothetical protein
MGKPKKVVKKLIRTYIRREPKYDYLKYHKIVMRWATMKYGVSQQDLDMLFFLYSEGLFFYSDFQKYANIFGWEPGRFTRMKKEGYIHAWYKGWSRNGDYPQYEVTRNTRLMITKIYKVMNGEEELAEMPRNNPIFKRERYTDKVTAMSIKDMNKKIRENKIKRENPDL